MPRTNPLLIGVSLVLSTLALLVLHINVHAQDDKSCQVVLNALANGIERDICQQIEQDNACYASAHLTAKLRQPDLTFMNPNEQVKIVDIRSLISQAPTGAAIMYVDTPDDPVKIIVFGDTSISPTSGQVFAMYKTGGQLLCERTPSGMLVQTKTGETGQVVVNGVTIRLHSTAFITLDGVVLFDQDPRIRRRFGERNPNADLCSGFDSECNFANCAPNTRLVWGPFCREDRDPYIEPGLYRVTLRGSGTVEAGATDFNATNDLFAYGRQVLSLPAQYTFCYPGLQPGGTGFETLVRSQTADARIDRITLEYLGGDCNNPWTDPDVATAQMVVTNVEGTVEVSIPGQTVTLQEGEWVTVRLVNNEPVAINQPNRGLAVLGSRAILWLTDDERGLPWINENRPPGGTDPRLAERSPLSSPLLSPGTLSNQILFFSSRNYEATADPDALANVIDLIDHSLYRMDPDGSNQELILQPIDAHYVADNIAVSPDGTRVAKRYSTYDGDILRPTLIEEGVEIFDFAVGYSTKLALPEQIDHVHDWSPDGRNLLFTFTRPTGSRVVDGVSVDTREAIIASLDLVTREITELALDSDDGVTFASWSPDGERIAFTRDYQLWLMNADGSEQTKLLGDARDVDWSPDGNWIAYESGTTSDQDIWIIRPDGANARNLTQTKGLTEYGPDWSPDSSRIAFSQTDFRIEQVYVYDLASSELSQLTADGLRNAMPAWVGDITGGVSGSPAPSSTPSASTTAPTVPSTADAQLLMAMYGSDSVYQNLALTVAQKEFYVQNGVDKLFVVTQLTPLDDLECTLCNPEAGAAVFAAVEDGWVMEAVSRNLGAFGMWGEVYGGSLIEIGDDNYGMIFNTSLAAGVAGLVHEGQALMYPVGSTVKIIFRGDTNISNTGVCERGIAACFGWSAEIDLVPGPNPRFDDIRVRSSGLRPTEDGGGTESADEEKLYRFDGAAYVLVTAAATEAVTSGESATDIAETDLIERVLLAWESAYRRSVTELTTDGLEDVVRDQALQEQQEAVQTLIDANCRWMIDEVAAPRVLAITPGLNSATAQVLRNWDRDMECNGNRAEMPDRDGRFIATYKLRHTADGWRIVEKEAVAFNGDFADLVQLLVAAAEQDNRAVLETLFSGNLVWAAPYGVDFLPPTVESSDQALGALLNAFALSETTCAGYSTDEDKAVILVSGLKVNWEGELGWEIVDATTKVLLNFASVDGSWQFAGYSPVPNAFLVAFADLSSCPQAGSLLFSGVDTED